MLNAINTLVHRACKPIRPLATLCPEHFPLRGVEKQDEGGWICSPRDREPCFELRGIMPLQGWYMVEMKIVSNVSAGNARISVYAGSRVPEHGLLLPYMSNSTAKRVVHLTSRPKKMILHPVSRQRHSVTSFNIEDLRFVRLLPFFARELMLQKIRNRHPVFAGQSIPDITKDITAQAAGRNISYSALLYELYNETFIRHLDHSPESYNLWIKRYESGLLEAIHGNNPDIERHAQKPLFTIVMPLSRSVPAYLAQALASITNQSYPHWNLLITSRGDKVSSTLGRVIQRFTEKDSRIRYSDRFNPELHNARTGSSAAPVLENFTLLMGPNDQLPVHALGYAARAIVRNPDAALVYGDHDFIDEQGKRHTPYFKPSWNPDLLTSHNYMLCPVFFRTDLAGPADMENISLLKGEAYRLIMSAAAGLKPENIIHVPGISYHLREIENVNPGQVPCCTEFSWSDSFSRFAAADNSSLKAVEPGIMPGSNRIRYSVSDPLPLVSILIPFRDKLSLTRKCVLSIQEKTTYPNYEIILMDNQSSEKMTLSWLKYITKTPGVRLLSWNRPFNYSRINNYGAEQAKGSILALVNNDIEVISPGWLSEMVSQVCRPGIGCVGAKLLYPDNSIQHGGVILGLGGVAGHAHRFFSGDNPGYTQRLNLVHNLSAVTGACLVIRKKVFKQVGGLEPELAIAYNDIDLCLKVGRSGYRNLWTPYALLYHHESRSRGTPDTPDKRQIFQMEQDYMKRKWGRLLMEDPYYNPNLTLDFEDFSLRNHLHELTEKDI